MNFTDEIIESLIILEDEGKIEEFEEKFSPRISESDEEQLKKLKIYDDLIKLYKQTNGFEIEWWKDSEEGIGGAIKLNSTKFLFQNEPSLKTECDLDPNMDQDLRYFRILDNPSMNTQVGFFMTPEKGITKALWFRMVGYDASSLDLDFKGYLEMALTSKVFFHWQKVLLDIKDGKESPETKTFKEHMPQIFSDFNWDEFIEKYSSLRISLNKK